MLARMSRASSLTWCNIRRMASCRCWSQSIASVQSSEHGRGGRPDDDPGADVPPQGADLGRGHRPGPRPASRPAGDTPRRPGRTAAALSARASRSMTRTIAAVLGIWAWTSEALMRIIGRDPLTQPPGGRPGPRDRVLAEIFGLSFLDSPHIVAPSSRACQGYRHSIPRGAVDTGGRPDPGRRDLGRRRRQGPAPACNSLPGTPPRGWPGGTRRSEQMSLRCVSKSLTTTHVGGDRLRYATCSGGLARSLRGVTSSDAAKGSGNSVESRPQTERPVRRSRRARASRRGQGSGRPISRGDSLPLSSMLLLAVRPTGRATIESTSTRRRPRRST